MSVDTAEARRAFINTLGLPPHAFAKRRELEEYAAMCGIDALKRQLDLGAQFHRCCWEPADGTHHPMCRAKKAEAA